MKRVFVDFYTGLYIDRAVYMLRNEKKVGNS